MLKHFLTKKTLRYALAGNTTDPKRVLFALHGYGELVPYFIRKFDQVDSQDILIVAPEGPHRFYLNGTSGRVGASWMTKEDREMDIQDNEFYLNDLFDNIKKEYPEIDQLLVLGFSQGGATAARWISTLQDKVEALILWACVYPPDLEMSKSINARQSIFVLGKDDQYFQGESSEEIMNFYENLNFELITFDGTHVINKNVLNQILNKV